MKLATIMAGGRPRSALVLADSSFLDIAAASGATDFGSVQAIIDGGAGAMASLRALVDEADSGSFPAARYAAADVTLLAPIPTPRKNVFCVGRNYAEHVAEGNRAQNIDLALPEHPVFFTKPSTAVIGTGAAVSIFPHVSTAIDYEVELAVVIGIAGRDIPRARALDHVFGYTILNDITARDVQRRHGGQYFKGKGLDDSCPIGPWIVTADEIPDAANLAITTRVNGELRQNGRTGSMIFDIPTLIASLSEGMTLEAGDILATGTPEGVGYAMTPPRFLTDGDVVLCEIEGIGRLENPVRTA